MDTARILSDLRAERARIDQAISAIEALGRTASSDGGARTPKTTASHKRATRRRTMSAASRKRISDMMKQRWAERRKKQKAA